MPNLRNVLIVLVLVGLAASHAVAAGKFNVEEKSIAELQKAMTDGVVTSEQLVDLYLERIAKLDATTKAGPSLHSVLSINKNAKADAKALDAERKAKGPRGPLHGIPILLKDNIESLDPMPTTAGSLALVDNVSHRDASVVARLRAAGAVILGKTNLSEWANMRGQHSISGWSGVGGLTHNPYTLDRSACGSSSGSGAAAAANLAAATVGTETDGSVVCPSSINGLVGLKPTVGLVSRHLIVPISTSQDTAGPMGRSVADVAALLSAMAGTDAADKATVDADKKKADYSAAVASASLTGKRIGVMRFASGDKPEYDGLFSAAVRELAAGGAVVVDVASLDSYGKAGGPELTVLRTEYKVALDAYLASTPPSVKVRSMKDLIAFNDAHADRELALFGQEELVASMKTNGLDDAEYKKARAESVKLAGADGIDKMLKDNKLDALVAPTLGPAWLIDVVDGDGGYGPNTASLAAVPGYPHLTVPMGFVRGLPVGMSFIGPAWSEASLLSLGAAYEARTHARRPPTYAPSVVAADKTVAPLLEPLAH